ncbi:MAG: hypothetical protein WCS52_05650 [bacterium]
MNTICLVSGGYTLGEFQNPVEALEFRDFMRQSNPEGGYSLVAFD